MNSARRLVLTVLLVLSALAAWAGETGHDAPAPRADGRKWRLGYLEGGPSPEYVQNLRALVQALAERGWLERAELPALPDPEDGLGLWRWLAANARGCCLEFAPDACYSSNWDDGKRVQTRQAVVSRLSDRRDVDVMIAMGTWAGQDLAALGAPVPTIVGSTSDPVGSGIIKSAQDSGLDNLFARVQPDRYQRQVQLFHQIVPFKTLGLVYEDSPEGRTYAAVPAVEQVARQDNFKIVSCNAPATNIDSAQATLNAVNCYRKLSTQVDAMYVTAQRGLTPPAVKQVADILRQAQVPSFAMLGSDQVRAGLLMSLAQASHSYVGLFYAETIARIFNGAKPRQLSQIWVDPAKIAINLATARAIGFDPPVDILLAADEVYQ